MPQAITKKQGGELEICMKRNEDKKEQKDQISKHIYKLESHALNDLNEQQKVVMRAPRSPTRHHCTILSSLPF